MAEGDFPVFSSNGTMLGNLTSAQGQIPTVNFGEEFAAVGAPPPVTSGLSWSNLQLPSLSGISASSFSGSSSGSAAGLGGASAPPTGAPTYAVGTPSNAQATAQPSASGASIASGSLADYFARAVIIILGFIFVAVGLNMFRPGIVPNPVNVIRR